MESRGRIWVPKNQSFMLNGWARTGGEIMISVLEVKMEK